MGKWNDRLKRLPHLLLVSAAVLAAVAVVPGSASASCGAPANEIEAENCLPGAPAGEWDISGAGSAQGFATDISVDQGGTVAFKIEAGSSYSLDVYRLGYYGGDGARRIVGLGSFPAVDQPECNEQASTGLTDCGNWSQSATWTVPSGAVSGIYLAVAKQGTTPVGHIPFVVRDDDGGSDVLFQTSDTTWQAYNRYGGNSLYSGSPDGRAYKLSYNRPFTTRAYASEDWLFNAEYPMVRWLERNGYDVSYFTGVDSDRFGAELREHRTFLSVGHDEYWSGTQRANVEAARDAGTNLAFFSGNEVFWKTRWEDGNRTLVAYKETHANAKIDPLGNVWTGTWRDPRAFNPDGGRPENALTGTLFTVNAGSAALRVPADDGRLRFWRNSPVAAQLPGGVATLTDDAVGYEWDEDVDNGARPAGLIRMSSTTVTGVDKLQDHGSTYASGTATHSLTLYRDTNGAGPDALVFGAGTVQWPWGLDAEHDRSGGSPDVAMQQATVNLLADMAVQPGTLQAGLTAATASTDAAAPSVSVTDPVAGSTVEPQQPVTIRGTAADAGGRVGAVEVSVDDGATWHPATGRETWSYTWTPERSGPVTLRARAADDSANLSAGSTGVAVTVGGRMCPCSLFGGRTPASPSEHDNQPIEVGVRFRPDTDGLITGLRYHKGSGWAGSRVGHLWTNDGTLLATATFTGESASGWQEAALSSPVRVSADTTYVVSYFSASGDYAADIDFFTSPLDAVPLHAPSGANGVYVYGGGFPTETFRDTNYWADVQFMPLDDTPPRVTAVEPADGSAGVAGGTQVRASFDEPLDPSTVTRDTVQLRAASGELVVSEVAYVPATRSATLSPTAPLAAGGVYTATVTTGVKDASGNALADARTWTFTTGPASPGTKTGAEPFDLPRGAAPRQPGGAGPSPDRRSARLRIATRTAAVSRKGSTRLRVSCVGDTSCRATLRLRLRGRTVASRTVVVGGSRRVRLVLRRGVRGELTRKGSLRVTAIAVVRDAAGNAETTRAAVRLRRSATGGPS